jgi:hypothetical protein
VAAAGTALLPSITTTGDLNTGIFFPAADTIAFAEGGAEAARFDSSGRLLIGSTASQENNHRLQITGGDQATSSISVSRLSADQYGAHIEYLGTRSTSVGSNTIVQANDTLGLFIFRGDDGTNFATEAASILGEVDGTPGENDMPGRLIFRTTADGAATGTERMRIDNGGNLALGTTSPDLVGSTTSLTINKTSGNGQLSLMGNGTVYGRIFADNSTGDLKMGNPTSNDVMFYTANVEAMRIDSSQRVNLGVGTDAVSSPQTGFWNGGATGYSGILNIQNVNSSAAGNYVTIAASKVSNDSEPAQLGFGKSRGTTANSRTIVADSDSIGILTFQAADGTDLVESVRIVAAVDGTPGADDMPGRLQFFTTADGASSPTERMRIDSSGNLLVGTTTVGLQNNMSCGFVGLNTTSYAVINHTSGTGGGNYYAAFGYNGSAIGSITQNGTTGVSYNTSSDYRLKTDAQPMTGASARVQALKPVNFEWISSRRTCRWFP